MTLLSELKFLEVSHQSQDHNQVSTMLLILNITLKPASIQLTLRCLLMDILMLQLLTLQLMFHKTDHSVSSLMVHRTTKLPTISLKNFEQHLFKVLINDHYINFQFKNLITSHNFFLSLVNEIIIR